MKEAPREAGGLLLAPPAGAPIVHGHIERQERAVNVITERMEPLPLAARVPEARTHNFG